MVFTNAGKDWIHAQLLTNTAAGTRGANFVAVSEDNAAIVGNETTLAGEIAADGLQRVQADPITHTPGTNVTTVKVTYTAGGAGFANVRKSALFNAATVGIMLAIRLFTAPVPLNAGDLLEVTWTITGPT